MENYYSSYPDSGESSPRSREIECENHAWDEPPSSTNYRVKFMCSYGGKIQPRSHDNQLSYVGGDTKILTVDRTIRFSTILSKLSSLSDSSNPADICFKYQLPGEDLDALISVTNDEDLDHMMLEYDRLQRSAAKPARLRLFLFPNNPQISSTASSDTKSDRQWFVDALNSPPIATTPPAASTTPDFLFGLDKGFVPPPAVKVKDPAPGSAVPDASLVEVQSRSDLGKDDRQIGAESAVSPAEIQRQIHELQRLQIATANQEQAGFQRKSSEETLARVYPGEYYPPQQRVQEKAPMAQVTAAYWQEANRTVGGGGGYTSVAGGGEQQQQQQHQQQHQHQQQQQQFYLIPAGPGMYPGAGVRPMAGQGGQSYYAVQRVVPDLYREATATAVYGLAPAQQPATKVYADGGGGVVRTTTTQGVDGVAGGGGYGTQVAYDSSGRAVYYTGAMPTYQTMTTSVDVARPATTTGTGTLNPEGKVVKPPPSPVS